jgi:DNA polymerase III subunit chi
MTEVSFHTGVLDLHGYACRLVRKAVRTGATVVVSAPSDTLRRFDQALWSFEPLEFIAHAMVRAGQPIEPRLARTPVWLVPPGATPPSSDVLVNLGCDVVPGFEAYRRVIEIVGTEPAQAQAARQRWRCYKEAGHAVTHHEVSA